MFSKYWSIVVEIVEKYNKNVDIKFNAHDMFLE